MGAVRGYECGDSCLTVSADRISRAGHRRYLRSPRSLAMLNRTVVPYSFPRNRAALAPIRPTVDPERCETATLRVHIPLMPQGIEDVRIITLRERHRRYSGEGEKQERGGDGFALSCVMVGAGVKARSPSSRDSDGSREEQEVNTVFVKASQDRSLACKGWRSVSLSATLRQAPLSSSSLLVSATNRRNQRALRKSL
jgi:hypothetical protein